MSSPQAPEQTPASPGYAAILTHVQVDAPERLACARAVAERFDAVLIGVGAEATPPVAAGPATGMIQAQWHDATSRAADGEVSRARALFDEAAKGLKRPAVWEQALDVPVEAMSRAARAADLIVTTPPKATTSTWRDASPADLVMASGRPVLVSPLAAAPLVAQHIVLAWKDTREARRAMSDALPFLRQAASVLVLEVDADGLEAAERRVKDVAAALKRHGVPASWRAVAATSGDAAQILSQADDFEADLIVAGAYGHSRLNEMIFGGVTRTLLTQTSRHILLSH
jgi:nucleotide-binding universal stress UspA family protein